MARDLIRKALLRSFLVAGCLLFSEAGVFGEALDIPDFEVAAAQRFATLALDCIHREYPNKIAHVLNGDEDVKKPSELTPAFYGCYDWHSAVHGHWLLARLAKRFPDAPFASRAREALDKSLTPENIAAEASYIEAKGRGSFERPYGLAWLFQLRAELREWKDPQAQRWYETLKPLQETVANRLKIWLPKLSYPVRIGEHNQTAFALGLLLDSSRSDEDAGMRQLLESRSREFYMKDRDCPAHYEPSGEDFLSPCLAEADLMRRILLPERYARWLEVFMPGIPTNGREGWLEPAVVTDPTDPKLAHLDGLNLSRAWMIEGMIRGLPAQDGRIPALRKAALAHRRSGLKAVTGEHYEGGHWLGTFAVYLATGRGIQ